MDPEVRKILQTRLVKGEITKEEYDRLLSTLDAPQPPASIASPPVLIASPPISPPMLIAPSAIPRVEVPEGKRYLNPGFYLSMWIQYVAGGLLQTRIRVKRK